MTQPHDVLATRAKIGVIMPAINSIMQPELEALRPPGVTNQVTRYAMPAVEIQTEEDFDAMVETMLTSVEAAIAMLSVVHCHHVIVSLPSFVMPGNDAALEDVRGMVARHMDCDVTFQSDALLQALEVLGIKRVGLLCPFLSDVAQRAVLSLAGHGITVAKAKALQLHEVIKYARVSEGNIHQAAKALDGDEVEGFIQLGSNLSTAFCAEAVEARHGKPFISSNTAAYWAALRHIGIKDHVPGYGVLMRT